MKNRIKRPKLSIVCPPDDERVDRDVEASTLRDDLCFLPIGCTSRTSLQPYRNPCDVTCTDDVPVRLYLGNLIPETFFADPSGWQVRYEDSDPDTYVDLHYDAADTTLKARFVWRGVEGMSIFANGGNWRTFVRYMALPIPENWLETLSVDLAARFNIQCISVRENEQSIVAFPDGALMALVFPVPSSRLRTLIECLDAIDSDHTIISPMAMSAVLARSYTEITNDQAVSQRDLAPLSGSGDRFAYFETERSVYLVHITCFFRDLTRIVNHCHQMGFIGTAVTQDTGASYPDGLAWKGCVMPAGMELGARKIAIDGAGDIQRVIYDEPFPKAVALRLVEAYRVSRNEAADRLAMAETLSKEQPKLVV